MRAAANAGSETTIDIVGPTERDENLRLVQQSHLLPLFSAAKADPVQPDLSGNYPGKVFEYFGARRPTLYIPGDAVVARYERKAEAARLASTLDSVAQTPRRRR